MDSWDRKEVVPLTEYLDEEDHTLDDIHALMENFDYNCYECKHLDEDRIGCKVFPDQVPSSIITGKVRHDRRLFDQGNDLVFELKR